MERRPFGGRSRNRSFKRLSYKGMQTSAFIQTRTERMSKHPRHTCEVCIGDADVMIRYEVLPPDPSSGADYHAAEILEVWYADSGSPVEEWFFDDYEDELILACYDDMGLSEMRMLRQDADHDAYLKSVHDGRGEEK